MEHAPLKIFIGFDPAESVAWHTLTHSIMSRSTRPVSFIPINLANLRGIYTRPRDGKQSNEFSFSRFLVPFLSGYSGIAVYFDCDMLMRTDVARLFDLAAQDRSKAVHVVQHNYQPTEGLKYLNTVQYRYPRKNWSSVVVWNCDHPANRLITPDFVNTSDAMTLHRFLWLEDEQIGSLDQRWNWLVGEYPDPPADTYNVHWTLGGPYFHEFKDADFSEEWFAEFRKMSDCAQREEQSQ